MRLVVFVALLLSAPWASAERPSWRCEAIDGDPVRAVACSERAPIYYPCEAVAVPVAELRVQARVASDLETCREGRAEDQRHAINEVAAALDERNAARAERDACEAQVATLTAAPSGPSWWTVAGVGLGGVLLGVLVGLAL